MQEIVSSEESRREYNKRKKQVMELLEYAKNYYLQDENIERANIFEKLANDIEKGEFSIVVVGEFSAGKSTLLNALMGKRILPSYSNETTATVNFLRHKDKAINGEIGRVFYNNGNEKTIENISVETIQKYVSTKGENVATEVNHLDLYLDSDFLKDGVTLVDSPGLNGVADGHREITEEQILKSHASIFLFNSDHPGSKTDFEFLHDLQSKVKTIIFVLNKIDEIKTDEGESPESVIETLKKTYKEKFPEEDSVPEIWPVAAYPALVARNEEPLEYHDRINRTMEEKKNLENASRLQDFENRLLSFLTCGEKAKQQLLAPVDKVLTLTLDSKKLYEDEKKMLEDSVDTKEVENQIAGIKDTIEGLEHQIENSRNDVTEKIRESIRDIREELSAQMSRLQERKLAEIDEFEEMDDLLMYLNNFEKLFISRVYSIALTQEENLRDRILSTIKLQYASQASAIENRISSDNIEINLSVSEHLDSSERVFEVGLKEMDEKIKNLESELKILQAEANEAEEKYYNEKALERKKDELKNEIKSLQERKNIVESQMLPPIYRDIKEVHTKEHRGGVIGTIGRVLFGGKNVTYHENVTDSTEHDLAMKERDKQSDELRKQITDIQNELKEFKEVNSSYSEMLQIRKMAEVEEMRNRIENLMRENTEKIEVKYKKEIRKIKRELTDYCDTITGELNNQVKKLLRNSEMNYIEIVLDMVEGTLKESLIDKKKQLENLEEQLSASEGERNKRIDVLETKIEKINELIGMASDLQINLSSIPIDEIKQETI